MRSHPAAPKPGRLCAPTAALKASRACLVFWISILAGVVFRFWPETENDTNWCQTNALGVARSGFGEGVRYLKHCPFSAFATTEWARLIG
jgi:hypothetical protein